jgi:hypothetical protein
MRLPVIPDLPDLATGLALCGGVTGLLGPRRAT